MLSNKWTFSLTSLVLILALCFVAPSAMAGEFSTTLSVADDTATTNGDVSFEDHPQVERSALTINVSFGKVVDVRAGVAVDATGAAASGTKFGNDDIDIVAYNEFGGIEDDPVLTIADFPKAATPADGKNFTIELGAPTSATVRVLVRIPKHSVEVADPRADLDDGVRTADGKNAANEITIYYVGAEDDTVLTAETGGSSNSVLRAGADGFGILGEAHVPGEPEVYFMKRPGDVLLPVTEATFDVVVRISEEAKKDTFTKDLFDISNADITTVTALGAFDETTGEFVSTGRDEKVYDYLLTITPKYENKNEIVIKIKDFESQEKPGPEKYTAPSTDAARTEGVNILTVKVGKEVLKDKAAGLEVAIAKEIRIPASGFTVFAKKNAESGIPDNPGNDKDEPKRNERSEAQMLYNLVELGGLPNLETFLSNGGTIDLVGPAGIYISEIMWGSDASLEPDNNSQWIEVANSGTASILTGDGTHKFIFYGPNETLPAVSTVADRVGTVGAGGHWSLAGKGQSGRTGTNERPLQGAAVVPTQALISMQRVMGADGTAADGTLASSWVASTPPALNFDATKVGTRVGTPGAVPVAYPVTPPPEPEPAPATPVATAADIMITEIMVDTSNGRLPQWIELTNVSGAEVSLAGWSVQVNNSDADADAVGDSVSIDLSGTLGVGGGVGAGGTLGKSLLLVAWRAPGSSNLVGDRVINVSSQLKQTGRYKLISDMAFMIALVPPQTTGILTYGDTAGNLDAAAAWDVPMSEGGRSSLIRRETLADGTATDGTAANGWVLASGTSLVTGPATWYGSDEDAGTPGYDGGGPLPVELSHFRPARDKQTGAVVITWSTQSELNNAGFFIKRSQQRNGEFKVINATMVAGAGTTSEKQFYTYTDTTAQPSVVYYYQIEDVSLDGNRQTLTRGIRLKGHVGAAGKLTTTWGDLKTHE